MVGLRKLDVLLKKKTKKRVNHIQKNLRWINVQYAGKTINTGELLALPDILLTKRGNIGLITDQCASV